MSSKKALAEPEADELDADSIRHRKHLGQIISNARRGRLSVQELSQRAGVSSGLISLLERGRGNPSFATLYKLSKALDVPLENFFLGQSQSPRLLVKRSERMTISMSTVGRRKLVFEVLTPDLKGKLAVMRTTIPPRWSNENHPMAHEGVEVIHVLRGHLEYWVGNERFDLEIGDTITYDATIPHWWTNATDEEVELISSMTPPLV